MNPTRRPLQNMLAAIAGTAGPHSSGDQFYFERAREGHSVKVGIVSLVLVLMRVDLIMSCLLNRFRKCKETCEPAVQRGT
jgi:hypothetical protein